ncbi:4-hydroxy-tetrahydrodipicolinate reductase [soil metagenome]
MTTTSPPRIAVSGVPGRLASAIARAVIESDDLELGTVFNPARVGQDWNGLAYVGRYSDIEADVVVEAGPTSAVMDNLAGWRALGVATVVGTSGFTAERVTAVERLWGEGQPACLIVPNFSIGAVLAGRFAELAAAHFETVEVIERHGAHKPDAPSGTALHTAGRVGAAGGRSASRGGEELAPGALGGDVGGVRVHSLRLAGVLAHQEVAMSNDGEQLSIVHHSTSYSSFANGALAAVRAVGDLAGVSVGLDAILGVDNG